MLARILSIFRQPVAVALLNQRQREALRNGDWAEAQAVDSERARLG